VNAAAPARRTFRSRAACSATACRAGGFAILFGGPGKGKTWLALDLARALVRGEPWLGLATPREGVRAGMLELELGAYSMQARLRTLGFGSHPRDEGLRVLCRPMLRGAVDLCRPDDIEAVREWVRAHRLEVLMVDALSRAHTASENKAEELGPVLAALDALRHETGCAIGLLHHERKQGDSKFDDDLDALRGHSRMQSDRPVCVKQTAGCGAWCRGQRGTDPRPDGLRIREDGCPRWQAPESVGTETGRPCSGRPGRAARLAGGGGNDGIRPTRLLTIPALADEGRILKCGEPRRRYSTVHAGTVRAVRTASAARRGRTTFYVSQWLEDRRRTVRVRAFRAPNRPEPSA
jgi:hypothetical protein